MEYESETLRRLQLAELGILQAVDEACAKLGIPYFLDGGTALGAVRHGGFIPWDDDADIGMLRPDYERFLVEAPALLGSRFEVASPRTHPAMAGMFAKVMLAGTAFETAETREAGFDQRVFVDVFPYDRVAPDAAEAVRQHRRCRRWQSLSYLHHSGHITVPHGGVLGACERAACRVAHGVVHALMRPEAIVSRFDGAAMAFDGRPETSSQVERDCRDADGGAPRWATFAYAGTSFPQDVLVPPVRMDFEGVPLLAPAHPEAFLNQLFGPAWRELPPEGQRRNHAPQRLEF